MFFISNYGIYGHSYFFASQVIANLIRPAVLNTNVVQFLLNHLERDIDVLTHSFDCNRDKVFLNLHRMLRGWSEKGGTIHKIYSLPYEI